MSQKKSKSSKDQVSQGAENRIRILDHAINTARVEGLQALTIGRMAAKLEMSKSGLFAHFGSKQKMQLATIARAAGIFDEQVIEASERRSKEGIARLWRLCELWITHLDAGVLPSGYFFTGAFFEYAERRGPLANSLGTVTK